MTQMIRYVRKSLLANISQKNGRIIIWKYLVFYTESIEYTEWCRILTIGLKKIFECQYLPRFSIDFDRSDSILNRYSSISIS